MKLIDFSSFHFSDIPEADKDSEEGEKTEKPPKDTNKKDQSSSTKVDDMCKIIYSRDTSDRIRTRAMLCHIYHHALHDRWFEARDLMLMSHLQETIQHSDIPTQVCISQYKMDSPTSLLLIECFTGGAKQLSRAIFLWKIVVLCKFILLFGSLNMAAMNTLLHTLLVPEVSILIGRPYWWGWEVNLKQNIWVGT